MERKLDEVIARIEVIESQIRADRERDAQIAGTVRELKATQVDADAGANP